MPAGDYHSRPITESPSFIGDTLNFSETVKRGTEIDRLSTLGRGIVDLIVRNNLLEGWGARDAVTLQSFATWRQWGRARVKETFPELFRNKSKGIDNSLPPDGLPVSALEQGVEHQFGTLPVLVTAPHGGYKKSLGELALPQCPYSKLRDGATMEIARDIRNAADEKLSVLIDLVSRQNRTPQTRAYFETQVMLRICEIHQQSNAAPLLHLDIHGFAPTVETDAYDIFLGTNHRATIGNSIADQLFAEYMMKNGYRIYLPTETRHRTEYYTAGHPGTLVRQVASLGLYNVASMQLEINARFRTHDRLEEGKQLARVIGRFCLEEWAQFKESKLHLAAG